MYLIAVIVSENHIFKDYEYSKKIWTWFSTADAGIIVPKVIYSECEFDINLNLRILMSVGIFANCFIFKDETVAWEIF